MPQPLVIAYHLIWTAYGWWLPNDPRGSGSETVRNDIFEELGTLHLGRKKVQPAGRVVREFYDQAADKLKHPLLKFDEAAVNVIADAFQEIVNRERYTCYACAIMPDHVHLLIRRHRHKAEEMIDAFQEASRDDLINARRRSVLHPVWGGPGWKVYLNTEEDMRRIERYIRNNPLKAGMAAQRWEFVRGYDGWLPERRR